MPNLFARPGRAFFSCALGAALAITATLHAGPLNPPPGPVASTHKTLTEIEPRIAINATNTPGDSACVFRISQPGSYYLTADVMGEAGKNGIRIFVAGAVTIDLNGFTVSNPAGPGSGGDFDGIVVDSFAPARITICNGTVYGWPGDGIDLATLAASQCLLTNVLSRGNGRAGINVGTTTVISDCIATSNTGIGIATSSGCVITGCVASSNGGDGFLLGSGSTITGCTAYLNTDDGIQTNTGCTVSSCTAYANTADGIDIGSGCVITANACSNNGFGAGNGAGIHVNGVDNRLDGNNCTGADRGIDVDNTGNFITRNTCSGNGVNWDIIASNFCLVVNATAAGAISGNAGGVSPGSADPHANFTY